jgi:hypothetical protein
MSRFYNKPASHLNLTPEIVDRLLNAYQRDLPRKVDFVDEVERWKIRWALVDDKPESTRHSAMQQTVTYIWLYIPSSVSY